MRRSLFLCGVLASGVGLLLPAVSLSAHHSVAAGYDMDKTVTVSGTVAKMEWRNPHALLTVEAKDAQGQTESWSVWFGSANGLYRRGWRQEDLPVGAAVTVEGFQARDGSLQLYGGGQTRLADGKVLFGGDAPAEGR